MTNWPKNAIFQIRDRTNTLGIHTRFQDLNRHGLLSCVYSNIGLYEKTPIGEYVGALSAFSRAIELSPLYSNPYVNRGEIYRMLNKTSKAMEDFTKAIEIDEKNAAAFNNCGVVYRMLGNYDKAMHDFSCAVQICPIYLNPYLNRAKVYELTGKPGEAKSEIAIAERIKRGLQT